MKQILRGVLTAVTLLVCAMPMVAQQAAAFFVVMPSELVPTLNTNRRKDMVDFAQAGRKDYVENGLGGKSRITELSSNFVEVELSPVSTMQMKLLPQNDTTTVIAIVNTVCAPACNSFVRFYNTNWEQMPTTQFISLPYKMDLFEEGVFQLDSVTMTSAFEWVDMMLFKVDMSPSALELSVLPQYDAYLSQEVKQRVEPYIKREPLRYIWRDGRFAME